jgi:hypothetical protein
MKANTASVIVTLNVTVRIHLPALLSAAQEA